MFLQVEGTLFSIRKVNNWTQETRETLQDYCDNTDWSVFYKSHGEDINSISYCITIHINFCEDNIIPLRSVWCYPNSKPWITNDQKELLNRKDSDSSGRAWGYSRTWRGNWESQQGGSLERANGLNLFCNWFMCAIGSCVWHSYTRSDSALSQTLNPHYRHSCLLSTPGPQTTCPSPHGTHYTQPQDWPRIRRQLVRLNQVNLGKSLKSCVCHSCMASCITSTTWVVSSEAGKSTSAMENILFCTSTKDSHPN